MMIICGEDAFFSNMKELCKVMKFGEFIVTIYRIDH